MYRIMTASTVLFHIKSLPFYGLERKQVREEVMSELVVIFVGILNMKIY